MWGWFHYPMCAALLSAPTLPPKDRGCVMGVVSSSNYSLSLNEASIKELRHMATCSLLTAGLSSQHSGCG